MPIPRNTPEGPTRAGGVEASLHPVIHRDVIRIIIADKPIPQHGPVHRDRNKGKEETDIKPCSCWIANFHSTDLVQHLAAFSHPAFWLAQNTLVGTLSISPAH